MKKIIVASLLTLSLGLGTTSFSQEIQPSNENPQPLSDSELQAVSGGDTTLYCVNGKWVYAGSNTWICVGDAIIVDTDGLDPIVIIN